MTPEAVLIELLGRLAALHGKMVLINTDELTQWPADIVEELKKHNLIRKTRPATSLVCTECEEECVRPVHTITESHGDPALFLVCEKRDDINRVPISINRLEQWQTSGTLVAELLSDLLELRRPATDNATEGRWEIGMLKGKKHSSHLILLAGDSLTLSLAGHSIALADVLTLEDDHFKIAKKSLIHLVDNPVSGAGDVESAEQRRERLKKRVQAEKKKGTKAFLQVVAKEEEISVTRLKQLIKDDKATSKRPKTNW